MVQEVKPLSGKRIVITRPEIQSREIVAQISLLGGEAILIPTVKIKTIFDGRKFNDFLYRIDNKMIDYIVFMSVNGVKALFDNAKKFGQESILIKGIKKINVVAIGEKTASYLKLLGFDVSIIPERFSSEGIVERFASKDLNGCLICIPRTASANNYLTKRLSELGAVVNEYYVYETLAPRNSAKFKNLIHDLRQGKIWAITFTSPSTVENFLAIGSLFVDKDHLVHYMNKCVITAIGPVTKDALVSKGVNVNVVPSRYLVSEMIKKLADYASSQRNSTKSD